MSKTSARSKGYRKTAEKKPYMTRVEWILFIAIIAVIAVGFIIYSITNFNGILKVRFGKLNARGANPVVVTIPNGSHPYEQLGNIEAVDGWTLTATPSALDKLVSTYVYDLPDGEPIDEITCAAYYGGAYIRGYSLVEALQGEAGYKYTDLLDYSSNGHSVSYVIYSQSGENAASASQVMAAYVAVKPERCILYRLTNYCESEEDFIDPQAFLDKLDACTNALTVLTFD